MGAGSFMIRPKVALLGLLIVVVIACCAVAQAKKKSAWSKTIHRQGTATLQSLVEKELASARKANKQVVVVFTADWCSPCQTIKEFLEDSRPVQTAAAKGRILFIDVDEWRGPAHRLIAGVNPTKLPTIVRLDYALKQVVQCYGTDLGLLDPRDTAKNLERLFSGKAPETPNYSKNPEKQRELIRKEAERQKARRAGKQAVRVEVVSKKAQQPPEVSYQLKIILRNNDGRRRWFMLSGSLGEALSASPDVQGYEWRRFEDHHRATYIVARGLPSMTLIPVASNSFVELNGYPIAGFGESPSLEVWELGSLTIDGQRAQFQKKLPYELTIGNAAQSRSLKSLPEARFELRVDKRYSIPLR